LKPAGRTGPFKLRLARARRGQGFTTPNPKSTSGVARSRQPESRRHQV
jgi:hypothetical protein